MSRSHEFLPWAKLIAFGIGHLRLSQQAFWSMTLRELDAALKGCPEIIGEAQSPNRTQLETLMQSHPDT